MRSLGERNNSSDTCVPNKVQAKKRMNLQMTSCTLTMLIPTMFCLLSVLPYLLEASSGKDESSVVIDPNAAELVRAAREHENWIHGVDSFSVRIEHTWTRSPEDIAEEAASLKAEHPDTDIDPNWYPYLKRTWTLQTELAFDHGRLRYFREGSKHLYPQRTLKVWDGDNGMIHSQCPSYDMKKKERGFIESYTLVRTPQDVWFGKGLFFLMPWLRTQPHSFWWWPMDFKSNEEGCGRLKDFVVTGPTNYRGVDCYVLETKNRPEGVSVFFRWHVGVEDRRLYGLSWLNEKGEPTVEFWTLDYKEIAPGCWFPMTQGTVNNGYDSSGKFCWKSKRDLKVLEIRVNDKLPDELFQMQFKEGITVTDRRFEAEVSYPYKTNRTDAEWDKIRERARKQAKKDLEQEHSREALVGKPAPPFPEKADWLNSKPMTWKDLEGKVVILDFWAVWCGPCRAELPHISRLHKEREDTGITVIGIHTAGSRLEDIRKFVKEHALDYPICVDKTSSDKAFSSMSAKCAERGIPYAVLIDQQGNIAAYSESGGSVRHLLKKANELVK